MAMSTQTLAEAARVLEQNILFDRVQVLDVGPTQTQGTHVVREVFPVGEVIPALVQSTALNTAAEGVVPSSWSIKVSVLSELRAGQAIRVVECERDTTLVGKVLLVDSLNGNGMALIRKGVASAFAVVDQQGKGAL